MAKKGFLVGVLLGATVGAVTSLLLAPKSGKELRKDIKEKSEDLYEKTENIREKGSEWISIAKEKSADMKDSVVATGKKLKFKMNNQAVAVPTYEELSKEIDHYLEER